MARDIPHYSTKEAEITLSLPTVLIQLCYAGALMQNFSGLYR